MQQTNVLSINEVREAVMCIVSLHKESKLVKSKSFTSADLISATSPHFTLLLFHKFNVVTFALLHFKKFTLL